MAFIIYVPGERCVEVSWDVNFHEEATSKRSKELECVPEIEEAKAPIPEENDDDSSPPDVRRENLVEHVEILIIDEPVELVNGFLAKRRSAWF